MTRALTYREALGLALREALAGDERVLLLGQDIGARGGPYGVTAGLLEAMSGGRLRAPLVLRVPQTTGTRLGPVHSADLSALLHHVPGLTVAAPATPGDAHALLGAAIAAEGPVVLLEHTTLYGTRG
jgi:pyruvate dehydrogenase E1 component beta subunit